MSSLFDQTDDTIIKEQMRQYVSSFDSKPARCEAAKAIAAFADTLVSDLQGRFRKKWFDEFYAAYPKRVAPAAALRKYKTIVRSGVDPAAILEGAKRYAYSVRDKEREFIQAPDVWLNKGRWEDEMESAALPQDLQDRLIRDEDGRFYYRKDEERVYV